MSERSESAPTRRRGDHRVAGARPPSAAGLLVAFSLPPWGWWPLAAVGIAVLDRLAGRPAGRAAASPGAGCSAWAGCPLGMGWMWFLTPPGWIAASVVYSALPRRWPCAVAPGGPLAPPGPPRRPHGGRGHPVVASRSAACPWPAWPSARPPARWRRSSASAASLLLTWVTLVARHGAVGRVGAGVAPGRRGLAAVAAAAAGRRASRPDGHDVGDRPRSRSCRAAGPRAPAPSTPTRRSSSTATSTATRDDRARPGRPRRVARERHRRRRVLRPAPSAPRSRPRRPGSACRSLVGVTEDDGPDHFQNAAGGGRCPTAPSAAATTRCGVVPFGEYMPLRALLERAPAQPTDLVRRDAVAGTRPGRARHARRRPVGGGHLVGGLLRRPGRDGVGHGGQSLLNPTNGSSYTGTILQTQQIASSRLRALESGRWVVQVAPTGFSAFVTPDGEVLDRTGISEQAVRTRTVERRDGDTWYARARRQAGRGRPAARACLADRARLLAWATRTAPTPPASDARARCVTGPSLTSSTAISVRNRPVATWPRAARSSADHRLAPAARRCSGGAAASQLGRRPRLVSP